MRRAQFSRSDCLSLVCFRSALSGGGAPPSPPGGSSFTASRVGLALLQSALASGGRAQAPSFCEKVPCSSVPG